MAPHGGVGKETGVVFSQPDLFIAVTALVHGLAVCSRDERRNGVESLVHPESSDIEAVNRPLS